MIYKWKLPGVYSVPAQAAGEELDRICQKHGGMEAADIVDESRPEDAVLHPCFDWDDPVAAEKWREHQARKICCCLVTVSESEATGAKPVQVRPFVHVKGAYHPMVVVINDEDSYSELEAKALRELRAFAEKNRILQNRPKLKEIFRVIDSATA